MPDPYRNISADVEDALSYAEEAFEDWPRDADEPPCMAEKLGTWHLSKILGFDDYSSWGEWRPGELEGLSDEELRAELEHFRGRGWAHKAMEWLRDGSIPAIVVFNSKKYGEAIGDGRGRTSLAVGLGMKKLPVIELVDCPAKR